MNVKPTYYMKALETMHTHMAKFIVTITVFSIKALTREAKLRQVSITSYFTSAVIGASLSKPH